MLSIAFANLSHSEFLEQVSISVGEMLCQVGHLDSLGLCRFKTSFTGGLCGVHRVALTVSYISEIMAYFASWVCFVDKL